jgi:beta-glucanase (GH16 family)
VGRAWKLALGAAVVLAIVVWDIGLPGRHSAAPTGTAATSSPSATSPSASPSSQAVLPSPPPPALPGILQPTGKPEFVSDFSGSGLDTSVWDTCYPYMSQAGCTNFGNSQVEGEWYVPGQVQVSGGELHLIAQPQPVAGQSSTGASREYGCRSGMVTSYPGLKFQYGYLQIVAQMPTNTGLWAALWLAAANYQWPPEVDLVETYGFTPFFASHDLHWKGGPTGDQYAGGAVSPPQLAAGWHTFALSWTKTQITWLIDGVVIQTATQHIPQQPMYLIADLADYVGPQTPAGAPGQCDGSLNIRSVTLWPAGA